MTKVYQVANSGSQGVAGDKKSEVWIGIQRLNQGVDTQGLKNKSFATFWGNTGSGSGELKIVSN